MRHALNRLDGREYLDEGEYADALESVATNAARLAETCARYAKWLRGAA